MPEIIIKNNTMNIF